MAVRADPLAVAAVVATSLDGALLVADIERLDADGRSRSAGRDEGRGAAGPQDQAKHIFQKHTDSINKADIERRVYGRCDKRDFVTVTDTAGFA
jgi:hypothetical protein